MTEARPTPFELLFGSFRDGRMAEIRATLGSESGIDAFLLAAPALEFMRELRPDAGLGDAVDDFVALVHAAYRFWADGERIVPLDLGATRALCAVASTGDQPSPPTDAGPPGAESVRYIQVAPRQLWGQLADDAPFEPLDGWFSIPGSPDLRMVACFGVHPDRPGVSIVSVEGRRPGPLAREDGTPLFAPLMPGGDAAGLHAIAGAEELLLLGWRELDREETYG